MSEFTSSSVERGYKQNGSAMEFPVSSDKNSPSMVNIDNILDYDEGDRSSPLNWPSAKKTSILMGIYLTTFTVSLSSSIFTAAVTTTAVQFRVSTEVMTLSISLYVLGFAAGPLFWAPLSEAYGRRFPYLVSYGLFSIFHLPVALAKGPTLILICRFLCGTCGSGTFAIPPAMSVDILDPVPRGKAVGLYMAMVFSGTILGPVIGAYTTESLGWRWTAWLPFIISGVMFLYMVLFLPETYAQVLLQRKARALRAQGVQFLSKRDLEPVTRKSLLNVYLTRPMQMLFGEPILIAISVYNCLIYGILYLVFFSYPYCFGVIRGWSPTTASLPFLALLIGILLAIIGMGIFNNGWWMRRFIARGHKLLPEDRIPPMAVSAVLLPAGLLIFAWTSSQHIHWAPQVLSGVFLGAGVMLNMLSGTSYLIDVFLINSNSAIAANVCVRSIAGAGFPLFAIQMYERLGSEWATSLLAFLCLAMAAVPLLFWKYGKKLRGMSRFGFE